METVKKLMERVNDTKLDIYQRYPELKPHLIPGLDLARIYKNILFVSPMLNKQGLYRMILPALELSAWHNPKTGRYNTIVSQIIEEDNQKTLGDFYIKLFPELIRWADFIVLAANWQNLEFLIKTLKNINPKIKIIMDMDRNYHALNPNNYTTKRFTIERQRNLENNLKLVDLSTYPDRSVEVFYKKKIGLGIKTAILPNLLSKFQLEGINLNGERFRDKDGKYRILLISDSDDFDDINSFRDTINSVMIRVPEAKVYVLGNSIQFENKNPLRFVNYIRVPYDDMTEYYKILWNMNPDLVIIPIKKQAYHRTYYKMLDLGLFGIPIVTMNEYPYNHLLKKDMHVLMSGQKKTFIENVRTAIDSSELRYKLGLYLKTYVTDKYSFRNTEMTSAYHKVFM